MFLTRLLNLNLPSLSAFKHTWQNAESLVATMGIKDTNLP